MARAFATGSAWQRWRQQLRPLLTMRRVRARLAPRPYGRLPRLVVNGFPKAGTHLLVRCVLVLGGQHQVDLVYRRLRERVPRESLVAPGQGVPLGIGNPRYFPTRDVERELAGMWEGEFAAGHVPYSDALVGLLEKHGIKSLLILRDPRDTVVSLVYHILSRPEGGRYLYFTQRLCTPEERLLTVINGVEATTERGPVLVRSIGDRLASVLPWLKVPLNYTTRFERLVGPQGGGSEEAQHGEIANIARHVGVSLTPDQVREVAAKLFGQGSKTFRRGQIGSWREHFNDEHKEAFKRVAGQYLIELGYERDLDW